MEELREDDPTGVGRFQLLGRLGTGGMGQVYLGRSPEGWLAAVKVIQPEFAADEGFRRRFDREVHTLWAARAPGVAALIDADPAADQPWLATEFIDGPTLRQAVRSAGPLPAPSVDFLAARLAGTLATLHAAGLVHRDVKPGNVVLAADGPRLIDFGNAQPADAAAAPTATIIGTPGYMSPEQADGRATHAPSDVFSFAGVVVYASSGHGPFGGATGSTGDADHTATLERVRAAEPDLAGVPPALHDLLRHCLAKQPGDRPTAATLATHFTTLIQSPQQSDSVIPAPPAQRTTPPDASRTDTPLDETRADTPPDGTRADAPPDRTRADTTPHATPADTPPDGTRADTPPAPARPLSAAPALAAPSSTPPALTKPTPPEASRPGPSSPEGAPPEPTSPKPTSPEPTSPEPTSPKPTSPKPTSPEAALPNPPSAKSTPPEAAPANPAPAPATPANPAPDPDPTEAAPTNPTRAPAEAAPPHPASAEPTPPERTSTNLAPTPTGPAGSPPSKTRPKPPDRKTPASASADEEPIPAWAEMDPPKPRGVLIVAPEPKRSNGLWVLIGLTLALLLVLLFLWL